MSLDNFSRLLHEHRTQLGLSQAEAARRLKVDRKTIHNWETGDTQPRERELLLVYIVDVLRLSLAQTDELLHEAYGEGPSESERSRFFPGQPPPMPRLQGQEPPVRRAEGPATPPSGLAPAPARRPQAKPWQMVIWLLLVVVSFLGLVGLGWLLLGRVGPLAQNTAVAAFSALLGLVAVLQVTAHRQLFREIGEGLYRIRFLRIGTIVVFLGTVALWASVGEKSYCAILPCGQRVIYVEPFAGPTPPADEIGQAISLTETRIKWLLERTSDVYIVNGVDGFTLAQVDLRIHGYFEGTSELRLVAEVLDRLGNPLTDPIEVTGPVHTREDVESLQEDLGRQLLNAIGVRPDQAHAALKAVFELNPAALQSNQQGVASYQQGRLTEAEGLLLSAIKIEPDYLPAIVNLGVVYAAEGRYDRAEAYLRQALSLEPASPYALYNLGAVYGAQQKWGTAVQAYQQAIRFFPGYTQALNNLADAYLQLGKLKQARSALDKGLALSPDAFYLHKNMGRLALAEGDSQAAILELRQALSGNPAYPEAQFYLAQAYAGAGEYAAACQSLTAYEAMNDTQTDRLAEARKLWQELQCPQEGGS